MGRSALRHVLIAESAALAPCAVAVTGCFSEFKASVTSLAANTPSTPVCIHPVQVDLAGVAAQFDAQLLRELGARLRPDLDEEVAQRELLPPSRWAESGSREAVFAEQLDELRLESTLIWGVLEAGDRNRVGPIESSTAIE
jgi:hypothetical protein